MLEKYVSDVNYLLNYLFNLWIISKTSRNVKIWGFGNRGMRDIDIYEENNFETAAFTAKQIRVTSVG